MAPRTPAEAKRSRDEAAENGFVNDAQARLMTQEIEAHQSKWRTRAEDQAAQAYEDAQKFGAPALDDFDNLAAEAEDLADAITTGKVSRDEGRRQLDTLLARHADATRRRQEFNDAAGRVAAIEEDPDGWVESFLAAHPDVRDEYAW